MTIPSDLGSQIAEPFARIHSGHRTLLGFPTIDPTGAGALRLPLPSGSFFYSFQPSLLLVVRPVMLGGSQRATWPWRSCLRSPTWTTHVFHCILFLISIFPIMWCKCYYFFQIFLLFTFYYVLKFSWQFFHKNLLKKYTDDLYSEVVWGTCV